jgi:hypothetical protein
MFKPHLLIYHGLDLLGAAGQQAMDCAQIPKEACELLPSTHLLVIAIQQTLAEGRAGRCRSTARPRWIDIDRDISGASIGAVPRLGQLETALTLAPDVGIGFSEVTMQRQDLIGSREPTPLGVLMVSHVPFATYFQALPW